MERRAHLGNRWFTLGLYTAAAITLAPLVGCGDSGPGDDGGGGGGSGGSLSQGGEPAEGGADSVGGGEATAPTIIDVRETLADMPAGGIDVIVNDESGVLVEHLVTDRDGLVEATLTPGETVSALIATPVVYSGVEYVRREIVSVMLSESVPERLHLRYSKQKPDSSSPTMTIKTVAEDTGAAWYVAQTGCRSRKLTNPRMTIDDHYDCQETGQYTVVLTSLDAEDKLLDYSFLENQPFVAGATREHALPLIGAPLVPVTASIENLPTSTHSIRVSTRAIGDLAISDGRVIEQPGSDVLVTLGHPVAFGDRHCWSVNATLRYDELLSDSAHMSRCASGREVADLMWDQSRLARFRFEEPTESPLTLHLTEVWAGEYGDYARVEQNWTTEVDATGEEITIVEWRATVPPGTTKIVLPELPDGFEDFAFTQGDPLHGGSVVQYDLEAFQGYDDAITNEPTYDLGYESNSSRRQ